MGKLHCVYTAFDLQIEVGDVICEIETDKATLEHECLEEGYVSSDSTEFEFTYCFQISLSRLYTTAFSNI